VIIGFHTTFPSSHRIKLPSIKIITTNNANIIESSLQSKQQDNDDNNEFETRKQPISIQQSFQKGSHPGIRTSALFASSLLAAFCTTPSSSSSPISIMLQPANAMGTLAELRNQSFVLQDISFNVYDCEVETAAISALTMNSFQSLTSSSSSKSGKTNTVTRIVAGFGPNGYASPSTFYPGVSTFYQDGGHATITYKQRSSTDSVAVPGNGLKFVKVATDELRLSKGIEKGK